MSCLINGSNHSKRTLPRVIRVDSPRTLEEISRCPRGGGVGCRQVVHVGKTHLTKQERNYEHDLQPGHMVTTRLRSA